MRIAPDGAYIAVTQVCKRDLYMYLLAAKSFFRFVPPAAIYALNDGSLDAADRDLIRSHLPDIRFVEITEIDAAPCPKGGCWERLALVIDLVRKGYVIQLDCDTLTLRSPAKLMELVASGTNFTQGTFLGKKILPMREFAESLPPLTSSESHVQVVAEANFRRMQGIDDLKYVRGCAGFAGFARDSVKHSDMVAFSTELEELIGAEKWHQWGSEQLTSNLLVANASKAEVLPVPEYFYFQANTNPAESTVLHFMGPERFYRGRYGKLGRQVSTELERMGHA
jgi:hypothetical protein